MFYRQEAEPEVEEHKKLVDKAILLLARYDISMLAVRGTRRPLWFLKAAKKQQSSKYHARHDKDNKSYPHGGHLSSWPLE